MYYNYQFHTPRNLLLALNGEVGELCEIFQWKGEVKNTEGNSVLIHRWRFDTSY